MRRSSGNLKGKGVSAGECALQMQTKSTFTARCQSLDHLSRKSLNVLNLLIMRMMSFYVWHKTKNHIQTYTYTSIPVYTHICTQKNTIKKISVTWNKPLNHQVQNGAGKVCTRWLIPTPCSALYWFVIFIITPTLPQHLHTRTTQKRRKTGIIYV